MVAAAGESRKGRTSDVIVTTNFARRCQGSDILVTVHSNLRSVIVAFASLERPQQPDRFR